MKRTLVRWPVAAAGVLGLVLGVAGYGVIGPLLRPPGLPEPATVVYCRPAGVELLMDMYVPEHPTGAGVLYFHGGAWSSGNRKAGSWFRLIGAQLMARGITVGSAGYRLAPEWPWPAQLQDAECALKYLRSQGFSELAVMGESSGGQLAAVLGNEQALAAAVDLWGPTELSTIGDQYPDVFLDEAALAEGSPARHPTGKTPLLTVTGTNDVLIPPQAALALADALAARGMESETIIVDRAGHSMEGVDPSRVVDRVVQFIALQLGQ